MDSAKVLETQRWLLKAQQDIQSAEWLQSSPNRLYATVGFHSQQCAEKAIKAYLTWMDVPFEPGFEALREAATTLTPYAVAFRYPGELPDLPVEEAALAISLSRQIWAFVLEHLPPETHP